MWFDFPVLDFIQENLRSGFLDPIMAALSVFPDKGIGLIALGLILLIPKKTRCAAAAGLLAMGLAVILSEFSLKFIVCRPRPFLLYEQYHGYAMPFNLNTGTPGGYSFPSAHSACAFAFAAALFKAGKPVGVTATVIAALIAFSRLYNYVHFPTDVFAGIVLGIISGLLMIFVFKKFKLDDKINKIGKSRRTT